MGKSVRVTWTIRQWRQKKARQNFLPWWRGECKWKRCNSRDYCAAERLKASKPRRTIVLVLRCGERPARSRLREWWHWLVLWVDDLLKDVDASGEWDSLDFPTFLEKVSKFWLPCHGMLTPCKKWCVIDCKSTKAKSPIHVFDEEYKQVARPINARMMSVADVIWLDMKNMSRQFHLRRPFRNKKLQCAALVSCGC